MRVSSATSSPVARAVGAIVRSAEAAGASGFVAIEGSADPWKEKALRGSAGSIFRLPSISELSQDEFLRLARKHRLRLVATQMHGGTPLWEADFGPAPIAFLFGAEGPGLPPQLADRCDLRVRRQPRLGNDPLLHARISGADEFAGITLVLLG